MKLTNFHIVISSFAALAGVALAGYQTLAPSLNQQPVNVTVALESAKAGQIAGKSDAEATIATASIELARGASFTAALKDGSEKRYDFGQIFDGNPETYLTLVEADTELNVLVTFGGAMAQGVTAIVYSPPNGVTPDKLASVVDLAVLPEGEMGAAGRPVYSFSLQRSPGSQTFAIPGRASGKGLWLRIAGAPGAGALSVGDFRILKEAVAR
jgi:hypothetical protein